MYIAVAGNIGSGKTTLTKMLARHYRWEPRFEAVEENPYLEDYYQNINRWSFNLEVYFLKERFRDLLAIQQSDHTIIQDRTIYEGVNVFMTLFQVVSKRKIANNRIILLLILLTKILFLGKEGRFL